MNTKTFPAKTSEYPIGKTGFSVVRGVALPVRLAKTGNLINTSYGALGEVIVRNGEKMIPIFESREEAENSEEMKNYWKQRQEHEDSCDHDWRMISHEERECRECGACEFVPDW